MRMPDTGFKPMTHQSETKYLTAKPMGTLKI